MKKGTHTHTGAHTHKPPEQNNKFTLTSHPPKTKQTKTETTDRYWTCVGKEEKRKKIKFTPTKN